MFEPLGACEYTPNFLAPYLVALYYAHFFVAVALFLYGAVFKPEFYVLWLSIGVFASYYLNLLLKWTVLEPVPEATCVARFDAGRFCIAATWPENATAAPNACGVLPAAFAAEPSLTCGTATTVPCLPCISCGMPALEPQLVAFIVAHVGTVALQYWPKRVNAYNAALTLGYASAVVYTFVYFNLNTPAQVLAAVALGASTGAFAQVFAERVLVARLTTTVPMTWLGRWGYKNNLMRAHDDVKRS